MYTVSCDGKHLLGVSGGYAAATNTGLFDNVVGQGIGGQAIAAATAEQEHRLLSGPNDAAHVVSFNSLDGRDNLKDRLVFG